MKLGKVWWDHGTRQDRYRHVFDKHERRQAVCLHCCKSGNYLACNHPHVVTSGNHNFRVPRAHRSGEWARLLAWLLEHRRGGWFTYATRDGVQQPLPTTMP